MQGLLQKLLKWVPVNLASILGVAQAIVKCLKELLTAVVNVLFPIIPSAKFQTVVMTIRKIINKIDAVLEKIKGFFLKVAG